MCWWADWFQSNKKSPLILCNIFHKIRGFLLNCFDGYAIIFKEFARINWIYARRNEHGNKRSLRCWLFFIPIFVCSDPGHFQYIPCRLADVRDAYV